MLLGGHIVAHARLEYGKATLAEIEMLIVGGQHGAAAQELDCDDPIRRVVAECVTRFHRHHEHGNTRFAREVPGLPPVARERPKELVRF
ncbi:MAG: hypothetical protein C3F15_15500 [Holophagae bacterium]|nr:MAG: hypothetical protein C3F15_15500 [Holophagae bacterium]